MPHDDGFFLNFVHLHKYIRGPKPYAEIIYKKIPKEITYIYDTSLENMYDVQPEELSGGLAKFYEKARHSTQDFSEGIGNFYKQAKHSMGVQAKQPAKSEQLMVSEFVKSYKDFLLKYTMTPTETEAFTEVFGYTSQDDPMLVEDNISQLAVVNSIEMNWHKGVSTERGGFVMRKIEFIEQYMAKCVEEEEQALSEMLEDSHE